MRVQTLAPACSLATQRRLPILLLAIAHFLVPSLALLGTTPSWLPLPCPNYWEARGAWDRTQGIGMKWLMDNTTEIAANCTLKPIISRSMNYERRRFKTMTSPLALRDGRNRLVLQYYTQKFPKWTRKPFNMYQRNAPLILFLGDTHDRWMSLDVCHTLRNLPSAAMPHCPRYPPLYNYNSTDSDEKTHKYLYFTVCENAAFSLAMRFVPGVHPEGPYFMEDAHTGTFSNNASWVVRTPETLSLFSRFFRREPDVVVLGTNYWDLARLDFTGARAVWQQEGLPASLITEWKAHMDAWLKELRTTLPYGTIIMLRTSILPKVNSRGHVHFKHLGGKVPVQQLNQAIREVAALHSLPLLDCERMTEQLDPKLLYRDGYHASTWLNLEWMNMILNTLRQQRPPAFAHLHVTPGMPESPA